MRKPTVTDTKLRAHLEGVREELKRRETICQSHTQELESQQQAKGEAAARQAADAAALKAAEQQIASLRQLLDRATEAHVDRRIGRRAKVWSQPAAYWAPELTAQCF